LQTLEQNKNKVSANSSWSF